MSQQTIDICLISAQNQTCRGGGSPSAGRDTRPLQYLRVIVKINYLLVQNVYFLFCGTGLAPAAALRLLYLGGSKPPLYTDFIW